MEASHVICVKSRFIDDVESAVEMTQSSTLHQHHMNAST